MDQFQEKLEKIYEKIDKKLVAECSRMGDKIPYIAQPCQDNPAGHGEEGLRYQKDMREENLSWWTNGFWAGMMWQMYQATGGEGYKACGEKTEEAFDEAMRQFVGLHHDIGFMWLHTAVADYRLTGREESRVRGIHGATVLAGRFNLTGSFIRAWNLDKTGWMIIDCMTNISLLYWASEETNDPRFADIANRHADTALRVLMREDGSCNHIAIIDPVTGQVLEKPEGQGYAPGSSWSRGQAWAIYGFALAACHTGNEAYLAAAKNVAHYFIANIALTDYVSLVDFRAPKEPVKWDTTAAACAACGLLQIADMVPELERSLYYDSAVRILMKLEKDFCNWNTEEDSILQYGTAAYHREEDAHVPIIYGDYFFVEGILRLMGKSFMIW